MIQPKFTPGPWTAEVHVISDDYPRLFGTINDSNGNPIDFVSLRQESVVANAALIAAAPDMYAALETVVDAFGDNERLLEWTQLASNQAESKLGFFLTAQQITAMLAALTKAGRA